MWSVHINLRHRYLNLIQLDRILVHKKPQDDRGETACLVDECLVGASIGFVPLDSGDVSIGF